MISSNINKQGGFVFLMEMMLVLTVSAVIYTQKVDQDNQDQKLENIKASASHFAQIVSASRDWVSFFAGDLTIVNNTKVGINYLKSPSCGGDAANPASGFLPCTFDNRTLLRQTYSTVITRTGSNLESKITLSRAGFPNNEDYGVAEITVQAVKSYPASPNNPSAGTFLTVVANGGFDFDGTGPYLTFTDLVASTDLGVVQATLSNTASTDSWLRTDGSNTMQAALDMNNNDIINTKNIDMTGALSVGGDVTVTGQSNLGATNLTGALTTNSPITVSNGQDLIMNGGDVLLSQFADPRRLSRGVYHMEDALTQSRITAPTCPVGLTRRIFTAFRMVSLGLGGGTVEVRPTNVAGTNDYIIQLFRNGLVNTTDELSTIVTIKCE